MIRTDVAVIGVAAVLLAGGGAIWYLQQGPDDPVEAASAADLPSNPKLTDMTFPKPEAIGLSGGKLRCDQLTVVMRKRGYVPGEAPSGQCAYVTPGASLIKDGAKSLTTTIGLRRAANADAAAAELGKALELEQRQKKGYDGKSHLFSAKLERFPAGEEGFISELTSRRRQGTAMAMFRSGADLMRIEVAGYARNTAESSTLTPLSPEVTYREITDILKSVNGQGGAGGPQITPSELRRTGLLAGLPTPRIDTSSAERVCAAFGAAKRLGTKPSLAQERGGPGPAQWTCKFGTGVGPLIKPAGYVRRQIQIQVAEVRPYDGVTGTDRFGSDLRNLMRTKGSSPGARLYALPVGDGGYALAHRYGQDGRVNAAFTVGGTTYVSIQLSGSGSSSGGMRPMSNRRVLADLVTIIKGAGRP